MEISTNMTAMIARTSSCHCGLDPQSRSPASVRADVGIGPYGSCFARTLRATGILGL